MQASMISMPPSNGCIITYVFSGEIPIMLPLGENQLEQVPYTGYSPERVGPKILCFVVLLFRALRSRTNLTRMALWNKTSRNWQHLLAVGVKVLLVCEHRMPQ